MKGWSHSWSTFFKFGVFESPHMIKLICRGIGAFLINPSLIEELISLVIQTMVERRPNYKSKSIDFSTTTHQSINAFPLGCSSFFFPQLEHDRSWWKGELEPMNIKSSGYVIFINTTSVIKLSELILKLHNLKWSFLLPIVF